MVVVDVVWLSIVGCLVVVVIHHLPFIDFYNNRSLVCFIFLTGIVVSPASYLDLRPRSGRKGQEEEDIKVSVWCCSFNEFSSALQG